MCTKRFSEMKWLIIAVFLIYQQKFSDAAVVRCTKDTHDTLCSTEEESTVVSGSSIEVFQDEKETASVTEAECLPGSEWNSNCHYCRCSDNGIAECLKHKTCDLDVVVEPIHCKPNTTFLRDCNTCVCLDSGLGLCTLDSCRRTNLLKKSDLAEGRECVPGTSWKSQCNDCSCSSEGYAFCTEKACAGHEFEPMLRCAPDTMWRHECNTCWCTSNGQVICTRIGCYSETLYPDSENKKAEDQLPGQPLKLQRKTRGAQEQEETKPKTCQPGIEFRIDCNQCLCDNEGSAFSCTRIDCRALNNHNNGGDRTKREIPSSTIETTQEIATKCTPGSVFDQDCNVCRCTHDGSHAVCTMKRCTQQTTETAAQNEVKPVPDTEPGFRCNPGEQFKRKCNDCTCSADGKSVFCTLHLCESELIPKIVM